VRPPTPAPFDPEPGCGGTRRRFRKPLRALAVFDGYLIYVGSMVRERSATREAHRW